MVIRKYKYGREEYIIFLMIELRFKIIYLDVNFEFKVMSENENRVKRNN